MNTSAARFLFAQDGPMTAELARSQAGFGLGSLPTRLLPTAVTRSICGFCSTGCSLSVHLDANGQAINLSPTVEYPVNLGMACPKGWESLAPLAAPDRVLTPLLRNRTTHALEPITWAQALDTMTARFKGIQEKHGPAALSFLSTGQITTEEMAFLGALGKFGMGMVDVDSNTRQCMATAHVAYQESFGFDAPPFSYDDFEESDALIFVGANPCIAHPIMWQRVMRNQRQPEIVVIDPRRTETAELSTLHLPLRPKSDLVMLYGLARLLIEYDALDRRFIAEHTDGFAEFAAFVSEFTLERTCAETGLPGDRIVRLAKIIASRERVSFWWTMGVNQGHESTRTAQAIIALALMTGNVGRPGTGANSITGQCNAMGSRLFGNATSLLGGYKFESARDRTHVAAELGIDVHRIPTRKSQAYDQILDAIDAGSIRGLWVVATNSAHSWINQQRFASAREKLDFLVVQDLFATTDTARMADLVLPAAGWGEKDGVFINSERRLGVTRKVSRAPGQALSDFRIFQLVAQAWGCGEMFTQWSSPEAAFQILKRLTRGQPCDFSGVEDYAHIESSGGIQWPFPLEAATTMDLSRGRRLFSDGGFYTDSGRARFCFSPPAEVPEKPDAIFPFWLLTGRGSSAQWHTGTRTEKSSVLGKLAPSEPYVEIHPNDAAKHGISPCTWVIVESRRGQIRARAHLTGSVGRGQVFVPMHYAGVNTLTYPAFDPLSRQPSYKACAVAVRPEGS